MGQQRNVHCRLNARHSTWHDARVMSAVDLERLVLLCPEVHGLLGLAMEAVGLMATFSVMGIPEEMPPRMPPWLLVLVLT